jgi:hypothetical protein
MTFYLCAATSEREREKRVSYLICKYTNTVCVCARAREPHAVLLDWLTESSPQLAAVPQFATPLYAGWTAETREKERERSMCPPFY